MTKMKKSLKYNIDNDAMYQTSPEGLREVPIRHVEFNKQFENRETLTHKARIINYVDQRKRKLIPLITNDMDPSEIIAIYHKRWEIELLFKQMKQDFPLKYFYRENTNVIKRQIWVTLIANLLLMVIKNDLHARGAFQDLQQWLE